MIGAVILILVLFLINQGLFNAFAKKHAWFSRKLMNTLFLYHLFFFLVYYSYALLNRSDSHMYFLRPQNSTRTWGSFYGTSTTFLDFVSWPFINSLNFSYEMMMLLYAWFGYIGFTYAYLFFRENIPLKIKVFNIDFLTLILFLPNMHFWTASLGKGAPIFMGLMMFVYALGDTKKRWGVLILSSLIIYHIRPHVFLFVALGTILGYMTGKEKVALWKKIAIYIGMIGGLILAQGAILGIAGLEGSEDIVEDFSDFSTTRAEKLDDAGSGVDMANYPLPLKLFTFWFRPLFLDAPGVLGLIVSMENLLYLLLFFKILKKDFLSFLKKSPVSVKMSITVFLLASIAMSFVMSNLGIIMRQKSMVMYFLFFVIYYYLAQQKYDRIMRLKRFRKLKAESIEVST